MKRELILFGLISFLISDTYHDGKYSKKLKKYKKHLKIIKLLFFALSINLFTKKHPEHTYSTISHMNGIIKYLPINKESADLITPLLSMADGGWKNKEQVISNITMKPQEKRMLNSGQTTSRSVSGTKKKYIASQQNWKCGHCNNQLNAWFEVDHKIRLDQGGSNHVSNLIALCRDCHGKKTTLESL